MNSKQMKEFMKALESIVEEKKVDKNIVIESMEQAMAAAYKKETGMPNVTAKVDPVTGDIRLYSNRTVVEEVTNEETEISLEENRFFSYNKIGEKVYRFNNKDFEVIIRPIEY